MGYYKYYLLIENNQIFSFLLTNPTFTYSSSKLSYFNTRSNRDPPIFRQKYCLDQRIWPIEL